VFEWCHSGDLSKWSHRSLLRVAFLLLVQHGDLATTLPIVLATVHTYCTEAARLIAEEAREREERERPIRERKEREELERQEKERQLREKQAELIAQANGGMAPETPEQPPKPPTPQTGMHIFYVFVYIIAGQVEWVGVCPMVVLYVVLVGSCGLC
jgi:hypothetical protein